MGRFVLNVDHFVALSEGGDSEIEKLKLLYLECDKTKVASSLVGLLSALAHPQRETRGGGVIDNCGRLRTLSMESSLRFSLNGQQGSVNICGVVGARPQPRRLMKSTTALRVKEPKLVCGLERFTLGTTSLM